MDITTLLFAALESDTHVCMYFILNLKSNKNKTVTSTSFRSDFPG